MGLERKTPLTRRSELARGKGPQRHSGLRASSSFGPGQGQRGGAQGESPGAGRSRAHTRNREPGTEPPRTAKAKPLPTKLRQLVRDRATDPDGVFKCDCCGKPITGAWSAHHRDPRGMGGSTANPHTPANVIALDGTGTTGCHARWESRRAEAYARGLLIRGSVATPETTPILWRGIEWRQPAVEGYLPAEPLDDEAAA